MSGGHGGGGMSGGHGGGGWSGGHGGGGAWSGGHGGNWNGWHGGGNWHGGWYGPRYGWYGGSVGLYLGYPYWGAWPYPYYAPYVATYSYPVDVGVGTGSYTQLPESTPGAGTAPGSAYYWYYCTDPAGYYPYIQNCSKDWMTVVPPTGPNTAPRSVAPSQ